MTEKDVQTILPFVRKPSSYLGGEVNSIKTDKPFRVSFALCFPDLYEIGSAHFGLQILYHLLNRTDNVMAERVFAPGRDMEQRLRWSGVSLFSLETKKPLKDFDVVGFSLLYELNYTNVLTMMDLSGIPFYAGQRDDSYPLIIAGGPCLFNPEPVADFFDAIVVGDGEAVVVQMADVLLALKQDGGKTNKAEVLREWAKIQGVYIPAWYEARYDDSGFQRLIPGKRVANEKPVIRAVVPFLSAQAFPDTPVLPFGKPVHDRLRLEVARGCSRGCRFCQAGMIYRPVRERSVEDVLALAQAALQATGYEDLSLLSLSTGDYSGLNGLLEQLMERYSDNSISVSIPSFRAGSLDERAMKLIRQVRKTGFTIAPEAGSQRLREVINKNITEEEITGTIHDAFGLGWNLVKLYFMIGLPTETETDVAEISALVRRLSRLGNKQGGNKKLHVSVATFIPKAHTPFQWEPQMSPSKAKETMVFLKNKIMSRQIGFKWQNPEASLLEGVFARGDRRLSKMIETAYRKGCRFDGWSDDFNFALWREAAAEHAVDFEFYTARRREPGEPFPWDVISSGISREFFLSERQKAYKQELTPDCRGNKCNDCGICELAGVAPLLTSREGEISVDRQAVLQDRQITAGRQTLVVVYSKTGSARYFGHLEFINIFIRAINRAKIPVVYSQGFHPKPKIVFPEPLPVGFESEQEIMLITISGTASADTFKTALNRQLPEGITIKECRAVSEKGSPMAPDNASAVYVVSLQKGLFDRELAERFRQADRFFLEKINKDGLKKSIDLKEVVASVTVVDSQQLRLEIKEIPGNRVRPDDVARAIFGLEEDTIRAGRVVKGCR